MWVYGTHKDSKFPIRIFEYHPTRNGDHAKEFLKGFSGYLTGFFLYTILFDAYSITRFSESNWWKIVTGEIRLSDSISFGSSVGFLGPNGAGKSTTIKMLSGILRPTRGLIEIDGVIPYKERKRIAKNIGVVFGQRTFDDINLTDAEKKLLDYIVLYFGCYSPKVLEDMTHSEEPWRVARRGLKAGESSDRIIDKTEIETYFNNVKEKYKMLNLADIKDYSKDLFSKLFCN